MTCSHTVVADSAVSAATWPCLPSCQNLKQRATWYGDADLAAANTVWVQKQYRHPSAKVGFTILRVVGLMTFSLLSCDVGREHIHEHKLCINPPYAICHGQ